MASNIFTTSKVKPTSSNSLGLANKVEVKELTALSRVQLLPLESTSQKGIASDADLEAARVKVQAGIKSDMFKSASRTKQLSAIPKIPVPNIKLPDTKAIALDIKNSKLIGGPVGFIKKVGSKINDVEYLAAKAAHAAIAATLCAGAAIGQALINAALAAAKLLRDLIKAVEDFLNFGDWELFALLDECGGLLKGIGTLRISSLAGKLAEKGDIKTFKILLAHVGKENVAGLPDKLKTLGANVPQEPEEPYQDLDDFLNYSGGDRLSMVGTPSTLVAGKPVLLDSRAVEPAVAKGTKLLGSTTESDENSRTKLEMAAVVNKAVAKRKAAAAGIIDPETIGVPLTIDRYSAYA